MRNQDSAPQNLGFDFIADDTLSGFRLHRLIDPETTPADSCLRAITDLQRAIGVSSA